MKDVTMTLLIEETLMKDATVTLLIEENSCSRKNFVFLFGALINLTVTQSG